MKKLGIWLLFAALAGAGTVHAQQASGALTLDEVIVQAAKVVESRLSPGAKIAILNFTAPAEAFSDYVLEELSGVLVMTTKITVIERRSLDLIRKEMNLQLSGDVSDDSASAIGKQLGAQAIVSGSLTNLGTVYRFRIKVINVETARIETQVSYSLGNDQQVTFLLYGNQGSAPPVATAPAPVAGGTAPKPAATPAPASPPASGAQSQPGLYVGTAFQGAIDWYDILDWITLNAQNGGNYTIVLGKDQVTGPTYLNYSGKQRITVTLKSAGGKYTVKFEVSNPAHSLFTVSAGVTFVLEEGITLQGAQNNTDKSLVRVDGGVFVMNGGTLTGNKTSGSGAGVAVLSGTFTLNNGTISGNTGGGVYLGSNTSIFTMAGGTISGNSAGRGGGVYVYGGTFTMSNGTISGNSAGRGGGVYVYDGTFTMSNGTISNNTASERGGGVYRDYGMFTKTGGVIYGSNAPEGQANRAKDDNNGHAVYNNGSKRNTTARATTAMDTRKDGPAGGWE